MHNINQDPPWKNPDPPKGFVGLGCSYANRRRITAQIAATIFSQSSRETHTALRSLRAREPPLWVLERTHTLRLCRAKHWGLWGHGVVPQTGTPQQGRGAHACPISLRATLAQRVRLAHVGGLRSRVVKQAAAGMVVGTRGGRERVVAKGHHPQRGRG